MDQPLIHRSYKAVIRPNQYAALDSGATEHFMQEEYNGLNPSSSEPHVTVLCANNSTMESTGTDELNLPMLPAEARQCHKFPANQLSTQLISVPKLAKANCRTTFETDRAIVTGPDNQVLLTATRDPVKNLYLVHTPNASTALPPPPVPDKAKQLHTAYNAYTIKAVPDLINYYHATLGYPPVNSWINQINLGFFNDWPGLTADRVRRHCTKKLNTYYGYQKLHSKNTQSTKPTDTETDQDQQPEDQVNPEEEQREPRPQSKAHDISIKICDATELRNLIATDLPGRYPVESARGHKYIYLLYDHDTNYVFTKPIQSRKASELTSAFRECYDELRSHGFKARMIKLDNEHSKELIQSFKSYNLEHQLVSPGDHRQNPAERAIQAFKAHFIATRSGTAPDYPPDCWDLLLPLMTFTFNLMRRSRINPSISAYTQVKGHYNFKANPIAPAGCKVMVHNRRGDRASWADRGTAGFFIDRAPHHYRNYKCYIPSTGGIRISNTVQFFPEPHQLPHSTSWDKLHLAIKDLTTILKNPIPSSPFPSQHKELQEAITILDTIIGEPPDPLTSKGENTKTTKPELSPEKLTTPVDNQRYPLGTIVRKKFRINGKWAPFEGEIINYDPTNKWYKVKYTDGDQEDFTNQEVKKYRKVSQKYQKYYSGPPRVKETIPKLALKGALPTNPSTLPAKDIIQLMQSALLAGAIWDPTQEKWLNYRDLIRHPNLQIRNKWLQAGEKEFGRLFQGFKDTEGKHVLEFVHRKDIPKDQKVTYPRYTAAYRPEKEDPNRVRITAGGNLLEYLGDTTTHTACMELIKIHWNSVISTPGAKYCTADCSNMYLESFLPKPQYVRFLKKLIPPEFYKEYNLDQYAEGEYVYAKIVRAWYGLKEAGKIAHDDIVAHLAAHGYHKAPRTDGLFQHETRDISFTLVVDDFGIKYTDKKDVEHLIECLSKKYTMKVDYDGKRYVGVDLEWDYENRQVLCSMDGYVEEALKEFTHTKPRQHYKSPSKMTRPDYGAKVQYVKEDNSRKLTPKEIKFIQQVTGKFLFYARAVDPTMLHALNEIAMATVNGTEATLKATVHFLNYAASNPNAKLRYIASDMVLHVDSDAAYLVASQARSRAGGYHWMGNHDGKLHNGPVLVLAKVIKNVMASAAEAEVGALFMNGQEAVAMRNYLIDMGHPQPATPMSTDNSTAKGIVTGTIKQKRSKSIDMRFYWVKDRYDQNQFRIYWIPGKQALADYPTKHHYGSHHANVRPIYLYVEGKTPRTLQGCVEILNSNRAEQGKLSLVSNSRAGRARDLSKKFKPARAPK